MRAVTLMEEPEAVVLPLLPLHPANLGDSGGLHRGWEMGGGTSEVKYDYRGWEEAMINLD